VFPRRSGKRWERLTYAPALGATAIQVALGCLEIGVPSAYAAGKPSSGPFYAVASLVASARPSVAIEATFRDDPARVSNDEAGGDSKNDANSFLRAVAAASDKAPPVAPERVAHFRILGVLGRGGMGVVYRAYDETLRRDIALKVLPEGRDEERLQRFLREARYAAGITHPNVAVIHQVGEDDGRVFIAMELIAGESLRQRLSGGPLDVPTALDLARQIASGLAAAHDRGIVHRDLKPENVMITPQGVAKLLDFGLAKPAPARKDHESDSEAALARTETIVTAEPGRIVGTPEYMSPEQVTGEPLDARSDVFSFGVLLYEMLTGARPFAGTRRELVLIAIARDAMRPLRDRLPHVDPQLEAVVSKCLSKAPDQRFGSAAEILAALVAQPSTTTESRAEVRPIMRNGEPLRPQGRSRLPTLLAACALMLAVVAGSIAFVAKRGARQERPLGSASASASSAARPTTIADLPLPTTTVPEALTEYKAGLQLQRDDSCLSAAHHFLRAVELDPTMALGHVRAAITGETTLSTELVRGEVAKAATLRAQLGERDRVLLDALEPALGRTEPDDGETLRRLEAAARRFPFDEEFRVQVAVRTMGDAVRGPAEARRATELDPRDALAWESLGRSLALSGQLVEARNALETCGTISIESSDCYFWLALLDGAVGRCADMEREARREADLDAKYGNKNLAAASAALGWPASFVREAAARYVGALPEEEQPIEAAVYDASLSAVAGDFGAASRDVARAVAALNASSRSRLTLKWNSRLTGLRIDLAAETGDLRGARAAARELADRIDLLGRGSNLTGGARSAFWILREAGAPLEPRRHAWIDQYLASGAPAAVAWGEAWARPARTPEEAGDAIAALASDSRLALPRGGEFAGSASFDADASAGHVFVLIGRYADAIPFLRRSAANCFLLESPFAHLHAQLDLGSALERSSDVAGACVQYGAILAQWGRAKPRSVTADEARARAKSLGCAPH
jgi:serine/threonine-protein kinase